MAGWSIGGLTHRTYARAGNISLLWVQVSHCTLCQSSFSSQALRVTASAIIIITQLS